MKEFLLAPLMGYDMGLLVDKVTPEWNGCGLADWIHRSLVWYSQLDFFRN